jgi:hypothetical protein
MAFSRAIDTSWGISVPDAYCRIEAVFLVNKNTISFHLRSYAAPEGVPSFMEQVLSCDYNLDGPNPIKQAYLHLKTLPEFSDAVDC